LIQRTYILIYLLFINIFNHFSYCDSHYRFPCQNEVVESAIELVLDSLKENARTLIAIGAYLIGKERIFHGKSLFFETKLICFI
jgi:hypothetical protein